MKRPDPEPPSDDRPGGATWAARQPVASLYVHVPFCTGKCHYCDFYSVTDFSSHLLQIWQNHLQLELERLASEAASQGVSLAPLRTLYFGGGTPSALSWEMIASIIQKARSLFSFELDCDITLEANPESYASPRQAAALDHLFESGVNRVSFGVQSSSDRLLAIIGRRHSAGDAAFAIQAAHEAGIPHIAADLMTGLPGQTLRDVRQTLSFLTDLPVDHLSSYALALAPDTLLAEKYRADPDLFPDDDRERDMTHEVKAYLESCGFDHYEISNFAKAGARSRHNLVYWQADSYLAAGPAASSYMGGLRRSNPASIERWTERVADRKEGPFGQASVEERIDEKAARIETMVLGLRLLDGVPRDRFHQRHGLHFEAVFGDSLDRLAARGLVTLDPQGVRLTGKGLDLADLVARELI